MGQLEFSILDSHNEYDVIAYEKSLFRAFSRLSDLGIARTKDVDSASERMRNKIPYSDLDILLGWLDGRIIASLAINRNMDRVLQLELMGFSIDKSEPGICEGLSLFNHRVLVNNQSVGLLLKEFGDRYAASLGIKKIYGTCSEKTIKGYTKLGFTVLDTLSIEGVRQFLIQICH